MTLHQDSDLPFEVSFDIGSTFPPSDKVAIFIVAVSTALRDLIYVNDLMSNDDRLTTTAADRFYFLRLSVGHLHELNKTIEAGRSDSDVVNMIERVDTATRSDLDLLLLNSVDQPHWLTKAVTYLRNQAFHYGTKRNQKAIQWALGEFQDESATGKVIGLSRPRWEVDLEFVDLITLQHFHKFPIEEDDEEACYKLLFSHLSEATSAAIRWSSELLSIYLADHEGFRTELG